MKTTPPLNRFILLAALAALPLFAQESGKAPPAPAQMDADSIAYMKAQLPMPGLQSPPEEVRDARRRARLRNQPDLPQVLQMKEYLVPGPPGGIPVRLYRGAGTAATGALPVLVYYHGGGWVIGDLDSHDWICRSIANKADCTVISVDYRLAPEHRFPAAYEDALFAMHWVVRNAIMLRIDPTRISVGGDSAGGNLASAVSLTVRDEGKLKLRSQILIYPAVDLSMSGDYYGRFTKDLILTDDSMRAFIGLYVPEEAQRKDWRASPLLAPSLQALPPTLVLLAGFDPLYAEGEVFAERLSKEGVATTVKRYPGQMHGFLSNAKLLPKAHDAIADIAAMLKAKG